MGAKSAATYKFRLGEVKGDDDGDLYTSFRWVNGTFQSSNNKTLRQLVANYILFHKNMHSSILESNPKYKTVEQYCNQIKTGKLQGGKIELQALAMICNVVIHVVPISTTIEDDGSVNMSNYGGHVESFKECVYILEDKGKKHYIPLCVVNKEDSNEISTVFERDNQAVLELLKKFIREKRHDDAFIEMDHEHESDVNQPSAEPEVSSKTEGIEKLFLSKADLRTKRKLSDYADLSLSGGIAEEPLSSVSDDNHVLDKPRKRAKVDANHNSARSELSKSNPKSKKMARFSSIGGNIAGSSMFLNLSQQEQRMKFEVEPIETFLVRTPGDFKPTKAKNRKNKPAKARSPRYFPDRNNKHVLSLLILEKYLSVNTEYCLRVYLITREINGVSYIQPYFKFQVDSTSKEIPDENPIDVLFKMADLEQHSPGVKQLPLKLVVVKLINSQLELVQQPLEIFSSLNTGSAITTTYAGHRALRLAYHLDDIRFAVTLYKKEPGETEFRRCDDMQCISQISTLRSRSDKVSIPSH